MASTFNFEDRFSFPDPTGPAPGLDKVSAQGLSDVELEDLSPELKEMVRMVRSFSVLLQSTATIEIFNVITTEADPRIALVLAAAKDKDTNMPLIGGLGAVKELMYADPTRPGQTKFTNRDLFSDGVRRVSCALTASRIIGQLAQIKEQAEHSALIEKQALKDLDRIIETWQLKTLDRTTKATEEQEVPSAFFFQPIKFTVPAEKRVVVEWQSPSSTVEWFEVGSYTGEVETWFIVNDLADSINSLSATNPDNILLSAAELSGPYFTNPASPNPQQYHALNFYPRRPAPGVLAYSVNVRVRVELLPGETDRSSVAFPIDRTPFIWGVHGDALNNYIANGSIVIIRYNKLQSIRSEAEDHTPFVLYFRNKTATPAPETARLVYRVQPWQPNMVTRRDEDDEIMQTVSISIPRLLASTPEEQQELDANRFSQVALALNNSLAELNVEAMLSGAIIRNDPTNVPNPMSAVELVAWARQTIIAAVVLDILEVPADIEIATGDRGRVLTNFSSKPRSALVPNPLANTSGVADAVLKKEQPYVISRRRPNLWTTIQDEARAVRRRGFDL